MAWDASMPPSLADGVVVDAADLNPVFSNVASLRYAAVFLGGQRRITEVSGISGTETLILQTPVVSKESGYLYKVEGSLIFRSDTVGTRIAVLVRENNLLGATVQAYTAYNVDVANADYYAPFNVFVKATSNGTQQYAVGVRIQSGGGLVTAKNNSWIGASRSGDATLMTDL